MGADRGRQTQRKEGRLATAQDPRASANHEHRITPEPSAMGDSVTLSDARLLGFLRADGEEDIPVYVRHADLRRARTRGDGNATLYVPPHMETT